MNASALTVGEMEEMDELRLMEDHELANGLAKVNSPVEDNTSGDDWINLINFFLIPDASEARDFHEFFTLVLNDLSVLGRCDFNSKID